MSFFTDDGLWLYVDGPRKSGTEEILALASKIWRRPGFVVHWKATSAGVNPSYDVGYTAGDWDSSYEDADGKVIERLGSYLATWKKDESGEWKVAIEIEYFGQGVFQPLTAAAHKR